MNEVPFQDQPLVDIKKDELGRGVLVELIVESVRDLASLDHPCTVYGIYGKWGEGKTSLMNFIKKSLLAGGENDKITIVEFNPWLVENNEALLREFFKSIMSNVDEEVRSWLKKYGSLAILASKTIVNAIAPGVGNVAADIVELANNAFDDGSDSLSELKKNAAKSIKKSGRHLLVMIDDVDRLDKNELHSVLRLIRQVADFDNCIYLVAMDDEMVSKSIGDYFGNGKAQDGRKFLEKIVNIPIKLPKIPQANLKIIIQRELGKILSKYVNDADISEISNEIAPLIHTFRDLKRYCNQISFVLPYLVKEVNVKDLCVLEAIKAVSTDVYERIHLRREPLMHEIDDFDINPDLKEAEAKARSNYEEALNWIVEELPADSKDAVSNAIDHLFSYKNFLNQKDLDEKRINTDVYFQKYFAQNVPSDIIPDRAIEALSKVVGSDGVDLVAEQFDKWSDCYQITEIKRACLYIIKKNSSNIKQCKASSVIAKALSISCLTKGYPPYTYIDQNSMSTFIPIQLIRRYMFFQEQSDGSFRVVDEDVLSDTMIYIFKNGELNFCLGMLCSSSEIFGLGGYDGNGVIREIVNRFNVLSYKEQMTYSRPLLATLYKHWKRVDKDSYNDYARGLLSDKDVSILKLIDKFIDDEDGQCIVDFVRLFQVQIPTINERLQELSADDKRRQSVRLYFANYRDALNQVRSFG